jgi:hypothetical protein
MFVVWPLPRFRFISQRLASILHKEAVSGAMLVPALEIPVPSDAKACPGTLALSMPEKRAAELEQRFDVSNWRGNVSRTGLIDRISRWWAARS